MKIGWIEFYKTEVPLIETPRRKRLPNTMRNSVFWLANFLLDSRLGQIGSPIRELDNFVAVPEHMHKITEFKKMAPLNIGVSVSLSLLKRRPPS